ncbi:uncharacterized protein MEPE_04220 [Melanopsichium pennsylvanicum]|uniref:Effector family protein Eff1 n=2 Tax=Melanopsichium pennsylvanicum TaxID=63383 RepID=A0AAJ4XPG1_9BASI|nr:uncharacterized protein BN887_05671 [Melanopsichium pennsylvanicum 4]SNX85511.1 uncharacterized protein MEPE_04220 [Melanopsichium pennsylvanicum]
MRLLQLLLSALLLCRSPILAEAMDLGEDMLTHALTPFLRDNTASHQNREHISSVGSSNAALEPAAAGTSETLQNRVTAGHTGPAWDSMPPEAIFSPPSSQAAWREQNLLSTSNWYPGPDNPSAHFTVYVNHDNLHVWPVPPLPTHAQDVIPQRSIKEPAGGSRLPSGRSSEKKQALGLSRKAGIHKGLQSSKVEVMKHTDKGHTAAQLDNEIAAKEKSTKQNFARSQAYHTDRLQVWEKGPKMFQQFDKRSPPGANHLESGRRPLEFINWKNDDIRSEINKKIFGGHLTWYDPDKLPLPPNNWHKRGAVYVRSRVLPDIKAPASANGMQMDGEVRMTAHVGIYDGTGKSKLMGHELDGKILYQLWGLPKDIGTAVTSRVLRFGIGYLDKSDVDAVDQHLRRMQELGKVSIHSHF